MSSRPQNTVQRPQSNLWESTVERRAIIYSISYEGMNQSRRGRGGKRAGNNPELAQVVIAGSIQCSYVLTERQFLVQDDPKIPDRSGEEKCREFSSKGLRVQLVQLLAGAQPNPIRYQDRSPCAKLRTRISAHAFLVIGSPCCNETVFLLPFDWLTEWTH